MSKDTNERGADGLTVREAIARRTLIALEALVTAHKEERLDFDSALLAVRVVVEANLPFVDPSTKLIVSQIMRKWEEEAEQRQEAGRDLTRVEHREFGAWS